MSKTGLLLKMKEGHATMKRVLLERRRLQLAETSGLVNRRSVHFAMKQPRNE